MPDRPMPDDEKQPGQEQFASLQAAGTGSGISGEFPRQRLRELAAELAGQGIYIGTSSWKYEGWLGQLYTPARYQYRGKVADSRFKRDCLAEYAETFKTVCVDAAYYTFPSEKYLQGMADQVPDDFRFGFKVTDAITIKQFPNLDRFGAMAGRPNAQFLNAALFADKFLQPCETIRPKVGLLMFEFSRFHKTDYEHGRDFVAALDAFLGALPRGWPYGVEIRNKTFLQPEYFEMLRRHGVAHVFNSWTHMPTVGEQLALPGSITADTHAGARFLLKPGRTYEQAVKEFSPYREMKEAYDQGRADAVEYVEKTKRSLAHGKGYIYVNNRFEGIALGTILAVMEILKRRRRT